jgi:hypothetical protein
MHDAIEREIHGPDHKRQALLSAVRVSEPDEAGVSEGPQREPVGRDSSGSTAGGPPDRIAEGDEPEVGPEEYSMATPRPPKDRDDAASPDLFLNRPDVEAMWEAEACTHTEMSEEMQERVDRLRELVSTVDDADESGIEFLCSVEFLIPKYTEAFGL